MHVAEYNRFMFVTLPKINSKWIQDLNIKPNTLNLAKEKVVNRFEVTSIKTTL